MACSHIYQSFQNSVWMGQTVYPDHDMFHSSDKKLGRFMAVSKAMSAAPVYLSDAPANFINENIEPLIYKDGELLRPLAPGVPLSSSFFADGWMGNESYSVIAPMTETSAAIVAYNISKDESIKNVKITAKDYQYADAMIQPYPGLRKAPKEGIAYYDWYNQKGGKLEDSYSFDIKHLEDRIVLLSEIKNGWAVIGLKDKYLSTVAVVSQKSSKESIDIGLHEAGSVLVYSDKPIRATSSGEVKLLGNGIYQVDCNEVILTLKR